MRWRTATMGVWAALLFYSNRAGAEGMETEEHLRSELVRSASRLSSLSVTYRVPYDKPPFNKSVPPGFFVRRVIGFKPPDFFRLEEAHGQPGRDWREDSSSVRYYVGSRRIIREYPVERTYQEWDFPPDAALPETICGDMFLLASGWWPVRCPRQPMHTAGGWSPILCDLEALSHYSLGKAREFVQGRPCYVLHKLDERDTIWVDSSRSYTLLQREVRPSSGAIARVHISLGGHEEVRRGIWMPRWFRLTYYGATEEASNNPVIMLDVKCIVEEVCVNDAVPLSLFHFRAPSGAVRIDPYTGRKEQTEVGGFDYMNAVADSLERGFPVRAGRSPWPVVILVIFIAALLAYIGRRGRPLSGKPSQKGTS